MSHRSDKLPSTAQSIAIEYEAVRSAWGGRWLKTVNIAQYLLCAGTAYFMLISSAPYHRTATNACVTALMASVGLPKLFWMWHLRRRRLAVTGIAASEECNAKDDGRH